MSEFVAYPLEALNETYLNSSHSHVRFLFLCIHLDSVVFHLVEYFI